MVTITTISNLDYGLYDEVWAIVRSLKYANPKIKHVPELSPSWALFKKYLSLRDTGKWDEETFRSIYVPQFLKEMQGKEQQELLNELLNTKKHICLVCFCSEEKLCHRSIVGGILQGAGLYVHGLNKDYSHYFNWWKNGVPGVPNTVDIPIMTKKITEYNNNVKYLYDMDMAKEKLFCDECNTLCFTGRRPKDLCGYDKIKYQIFVDDLVKLLYKEFYVKQGVRRFISGGAQGFDQMAFWAVDKMKKAYKCNDIQNIVFVPFEGQEVRWSKRGLFSQAEYWMMIKNADMVVVVCDNNSIESLFTRNHVMCNHSAICLGLYPDDHWKTSKGGTAECLRYAVNNCPNTIRLEYEIDRMGLHMETLHSIDRRKI